MEKNVVIITGDSSGLGKCLSELFAEDSIVYGLSRREMLENPNHYQCDVLDYAGLCGITKEIFERHGHIDMMVCCAGMGIAGAVELMSVDDINCQIDINFKGVVNANKAVIPYMRKQKSGRIINISSVAAVAPIPFQSMYSASKAAINSYSMALANELASFGIKVISIMPGDIHTGFTTARRKIEDKDNLYQGLVSLSTSIMESDENCGWSASDEAAKIYRCINKKHPKPVYAIGFNYKVIAFLIRICPHSFVNWALRKKYLKQ